MAKLLGPDFINLQVRDLSTSRAFYTEVLGLTEDPHFSAPGVVLFDSTTIPFALSEPRVNLDEASSRLTKEHGNDIILTIEVLLREFWDVK